MNLTLVVVKYLIRINAKMIIIFNRLIINKYPQELILMC